MGKFKPFFLAAIFLIISACAITDEDGDGNPDVEPPPPQGDVDLGFSVMLTDPKATSVSYEEDWKRFDLHKGDSEYGEPCIAEEGESITCTVEADELDLSYFGLTYYYNVPPEMCDYLLHRIYYYYGLEAGNGPAAVQVDTDASGVVGLDDGFGAGTPNDGIIDQAATTTCQYDYTTAKGPNCCEGDYTKVTRTWDASIPGYTTAFSELNWGGSHANCLDGPAMVSQGKDKNGFPLFPITWVSGVGIQQSYKIDSPLTGKRAIVYAANWYDPTVASGDHALADPDDGALRVPEALIGPAVRKPQRYYQFDCLDRDSEVVSRITMSIREWNTEAAFDARETSPTNHGVTGSESTPFGTDLLNDEYDWKDIEGFGGFPGLP